MSQIEWTEQTWNWVVGCSKISPGCQNCYAAEAAKSARLQQFDRYKAVSGWDGTIVFDENQLLKPLKRRTPTTYFTASMSDIFHYGVNDEWLDKAFAVMLLSPQHTFQVLTKRPKRMRQYFQSNWRDRVRDEIAAMGGNGAGVDEMLPKNIWLGVSVENQEYADSRIPLLICAPTQVKFLSCEPLLEAIDIIKYMGRETFVNWVIVGGESGKDSRPCNMDWIRSVVKQCQDADVPVFVKQLGSVPIAGDASDRAVISRGKGGDISQFPEDLRVRDFPLASYKGVPGATPL